jgi:hypothetical protein
MMKRTDNFPAQFAYRILAIFFLIFSLFAASRPAPVQAAVISLVVTLADDRLEDPNTCTNDPDTSDCSLREAIALANANPTDSFVITFASSITGLPVTLSIAPVNNSVENDNNSGDLDIAGTATITITGDGSTIIDGGGLDRVLEVGSSANLTLNYLTIQNGNPHAVNNYGSMQPARGGGIHNSGTLTLHYVNVTGNKTDNGGSGSPGGYGGGIYNEGAAYLYNSTISGNLTGDGSDSKEGGGGGGLMNAYNATATITNTTIADNQTGAGGATYYGGHGGGIYNQGTAILSNVTISGNHTGNGTGGTSGGDGGSGGGIYNDGGAFLQINGNGTQIINNSTGNGGSPGGNGGPGGGLSNSGSVTELNGALFEGNITGNGGSRCDAATGGQGGNGGGIANFGIIDVASSVAATINANQTGTGGDCAGEGGHGGGLYNTGAIKDPLRVIVEYNLTGNGGSVPALSNELQGGDGGDGGGIYNANGGSISYSGGGYPQGIEQSQIFGNQTGTGGKGGKRTFSLSKGGDGGDGGGIFNAGSIAAIRYTSITNNATGRGYGAYNDASGPTYGGDGGRGAGIYSEQSNILLTASTVRGNQTGNGGETSATTGQGGIGGAGGGVFVFSQAAMVIFNSTITENEAGYGGRSGTTHNQAGGDGSGVYVDSSGDVTIVHATITSNLNRRNPNAPALDANNAGHGAGLFIPIAKNITRVKASVLSGNLREISGGTQHSDCATGLGVSTALVSQGYNLVQYPATDVIAGGSIVACTPFTPAGKSYGDPIDLNTADPQLTWVDTDVDSPTSYYLPSETSPILGLESSAVCINDIYDAATLLSDQRNHQRPQGNGCEAGSVEVGGGWRVMLPLVWR